MFFIRYPLLNILRNKRLFAPMFAVFVLSLLMILYFFGISKNVSEAYDKNYINAVAITTKSEYFNDPRTLNLTISNGLAESLVLPEYVADFYILEELKAGSNNTRPVPNDINELYTNEDDLKYFRYPAYFRLASYSDISKSVDFMSGKRVIAEGGRYAVRANECNISMDLAKLNGFTLGSTISLTIWDTDTIINLKVVGIFTDETREVGSELDFIMSVHNASGSAEASIAADRRNDILTVADTLNAIETVVFKTALYYIHDEESLNTFRQETGKILPDAFIMLDNHGTMRFIRRIIEGTKDSYLLLLVIIGILCSIFYTLIIINNFKARTYDIGVLRSRGLSRKKTALLFACEVFITSTAAFAAACLIYFITFIPFTEFIYGIQRNHVNNLMWYQGGVGVEIANTVLNYKFTVSFSGFELAGSFLVSVIFAVVIGFASVSYIARNEPMKTMVEY